MKLIHLLLTISLASAGSLSGLKGKASVRFHDVALDRIDKLDYEDDPASYRKLTLGEMAREFAAFEDSDEENDGDENSKVMTTRVAKKRKGGHDSQSHERGHKGSGQRGHSHKHKQKDSEQHHHSHEYRHIYSHEHGHHRHHGGGHHHSGKHSHDRDVVSEIEPKTSTTKSTVIIPTPSTASPGTTPTTTTIIATTTKENEQQPATRR